MEDRELLNLMATSTDTIEWMVFKVKKRAKKDFEKYRRSLVTNDTSAIPETIGDYTYNWPYDYFSLVELAKIDATAQWTSRDMQYEISDTDAGELDGRPMPARPTIPSNPDAPNRRRRGRRGSPAPQIEAATEERPARSERRRRRRRTPRTRTRRTRGEDDS